MSGRPGVQVAGGTALTLLTGDTVEIDGRGEHRVLRYEPADGRAHVEAVHQEIDGELFVFPQDVIPYLASGALDRELFNIDRLSELHYTDRHTDVIPVIVTGDRDAATSRLDSLPGATSTAELESIDGRAVDVTKAEADGFWRSIQGAVDRTGRAQLTGGLDRVWLNARVTAHLEDSVPQIGAPAAWSAGLEGEGIRVAVLDTGVDDTHPDLAGQVVAEQNFSTSPTAEDHVGHGTHVASTIAGTGEASDGLRVGVAPKAELLSGKVLDDTGSGSYDQLIEGMEWAVEQDADIVNMSLGGPATDGQDVLSLALNALSATSDTLFVVSAGNSGPGEQTIGTPGAADASLTVGAVDDEDVVAEFSSRGPRLGDMTIKPDVTAPGVRIIAARATGTAMGEVVDDHHVAASGTSMAAPHVAGAAALLAEHRPEWDDEQLKAALISTSLPLSRNFDRDGIGRIDVATAIGQDVYGPGNVQWDRFQRGDTEPTTHTLRWTNTSSVAVDLSLSVELWDGSGNLLPPGAITPSETQVSAPADGTVAVEFVVDPTRLPVGRFTGTVTATAGDATTRTAVTVAKLPPVHEVVLSPRTPGQMWVVIMHGQNRDYDQILSVSGPTPVRLAEGDYFLHAASEVVRAGEETALVKVDPDLEVTGDMDLVLDDKGMAPVKIVTPQPAEQRGGLGFITYRKVGSRQVWVQTNKFDNTTSIWVSPTAPAKGGAFEFVSRWQLVAPMLTASWGAEHRRSVWPSYLNTSPLLKGHRDLRVVKAGRGLPSDYGAVDVRGKIAWVAPEGDVNGEELAAAAEEAGAAFLLVTPPNRTIWYTDWQSYGDRLPVPAAVLTPREARRLETEYARAPRLRLHLEGTPDSPYLYDVMQVSDGRVPDQVRHDVAGTSARIDTEYRWNGGTGWTQEQRFGWRPWLDINVIDTQRDVRAPSRRTEWVTAGDTVWRHHVRPFGSSEWGPLQTGMHQDYQTYVVGDRASETWNGAVVRPAVPEHAAWMTSYRTGRQLVLRVPTFADADGGHYGFAEADWGAGKNDVVHAEVLENGTEVAEADHLWGLFPVEEADARYEVRLETERDRSDWIYGIRTSTTWKFRSAEQDGEAALAMMHVGYGVPADARNTVPSQKSARLRFEVSIPGRESPRIRSFRVWASYDDGVGWQELRVSEGEPGSYVTSLRSPGGRGSSRFVSLRVRARDAAGNSVEQQVLRAFGVRR